MSYSTVLTTVLDFLDATVSPTHRQYLAMIPDIQAPRVTTALPVSVDSTSYREVWAVDCAVAVWSQDFEGLFTEISTVVDSLSSSLQGPSVCPPAFRSAGYSVSSSAINITGPFASAASQSLSTFDGVWSNITFTLTMESI